MACPTLVALTHGWDYRLVVILGAAVAAALAGRRGTRGARRLVLAEVAGLAVLALPIARREATSRGAARTGDY